MGIGKETILRFATSSLFDDEWRGFEAPARQRRSGSFENKHAIAPPRRIWAWKKARTNWLGCQGLERAAEVMAPHRKLRQGRQEQPSWIDQACLILPDTRVPILLYNLACHPARPLLALPKTLLFSCILNQLPETVSGLCNC